MGLGCAFSPVGDPHHSVPSVRVSVVAGKVRRAGATARHAAATASPPTIPLPLRGGVLWSPINMQYTCDN